MFVVVTQATRTYPTKPSYSYCQVLLIISTAYLPSLHLCPVTLDLHRKGCLKAVALNVCVCVWSGWNHWHSKNHYKLKCKKIVLKEVKLCVVWWLARVWVLCWSPVQVDEYLFTLIIPYPITLSLSCHAIQSMEWLWLWLPPVHTIPVQRIQCCPNLLSTHLDCCPLYLQKWAEKRPSGIILITK